MSPPLYIVVFTTVFAVELHITVSSHVHLPVVIGRKMASSIETLLPELEPHHKILPPYTAQMFWYSENSNITKQTRS